MGDAMLYDSHGRRIEYLRLSVADCCDLRCTYCMPAGFKGYEEPANVSYLEKRIAEIDPLPSLMTGSFIPVKL